MRWIPNLASEEAARYHAEGFFTDATYRMWKICRRYMTLRQEGRKRGDAVRMLMEEFNLSDKRIEELIDPPRRSQRSPLDGE